MCISLLDLKRHIQFAGTNRNGRLEKQEFGIGTGTGVGTGTGTGTGIGTGTGTGAGTRTSCFRKKTWKGRP